MLFDFIQGMQDAQMRKPRRRDPSQGLPSEAYERGYTAEEELRQIREDLKSLEGRLEREEGE